MGDTYHNNMIKFSISFPEGWSIIKDQETFRLLGHEVPNDQVLLEKWKKAKAKPLVICYRFKDSDYDSIKTIKINPNITALIEYIPAHVNLNNAYQYIPKYKAALSKHKNVEYIFEANQTVTISDLQFELVAFKFEQFGKTIKKRTYLHKYGDYMLNITLVFADDDIDSFNKMITSMLSLVLKKD